MKKFPEKIHRGKRYGLITIAVFSSIVVGILIIVIGMIYYKHVISELGISEASLEQEYSYHYAIISEEVDATFFDAIYQGALEKGKEQSAYVEKIGSNLSIQYSLQDLMRIAIASKVDGIILEPNGDEDVAELINVAYEANIPVVTVLRDVTNSKRISYIGINSYTQDQIYAREVLDIVEQGKKNITVILNEDSSDTTQKYIYQSILDAVEDRGATVRSMNVSTKSAFSSEEDIRNLIKNDENPTDLFVCLTAMDTLCAYQAVVDYNRVGEIDIVGYYDADYILRAIEMNIVHSTMTIDANQMGTYCVEALSEYIQTNNVSDFYSVDIDVIDNHNIKDYIKKEDDHEAE